MHIPSTLAKNALGPLTVSTPDWELSAPLRGTPAEPGAAEVGAGQCRAPLKSIGSGDVSMAIDPLRPIGGTR